MVSLLNEALLTKFLKKSSNVTTFEKKLKIDKVKFRTEALPPPLGKHVWVCTCMRERGGDLIRLVWCYKLLLCEIAFFEVQEL